MQFIELINELGDALQEDMWWDGNAMCIAMGTARIFVEYVPDRDNLYLYAHLGAISRAELATMGSPLLKASLFGTETDGAAVFSYDEEAGQIVLWESHLLSSLVFDEFQQKFLLFMASVDEWRKRLSQERELPAIGQVSFA